MAVIESLDYFDDLSRVRIELGELNTNETYVLERSLDEDDWITVRGGQRISGQTSVTIDDYEFTPNTENFYRLRAANPGLILGGWDSTIGGLHIYGEEGNYAETEDFSTITGDISVRASVHATPNRDDLEVIVSQYNTQIVGSPPEISGAGANSSSGSDPALAPSINAPDEGLLICSWTSWTFNEQYDLPGSMTEVIQQTESVATSAVATEVIEESGSTGSRGASASQSDPWSAISVFVPGGEISIEDMQWTSAEDGPVDVTTEDAEEGWWIVSVYGCNWTDFSVNPNPAGGDWQLIADSGGTGDASHTIAWAREVTSSGPQTVEMQDTTEDGDNFLTVFLISGYDPTQNGDPADGAWMLRINQNNRLQFIWTEDGTRANEYQATSTAAISTGNEIHVRADLEVAVPDEEETEESRLEVASGGYIETQLEDDEFPGAMTSLDYRVEVTAPNVDDGLLCLGAQWIPTDGSRSWAFYLTDDDRLALDVSSNGNTLNGITSSIPIDSDNGRRFFFRFTYVPTGLGNATVTFFTGESMDGPWQALPGAQVMISEMAFGVDTAVTVGGFENQSTPTDELAIFHRVRLVDPEDSSESLISLNIGNWSPNDSTHTDNVGNEWSLNDDASGSTAEIFAQQVFDHRVRFFTGNSIEGPWTQLGSTINRSGETEMFDSSAPLMVGARFQGNAENFSGVIRRVEVYDGLEDDGGTLAADPYFSEEAQGTTEFDDGVGNNWTVEGDAEILQPDPSDNAYIVTPHHEDLNVQEGFRITVDATSSDWLPNGVRTLVGKWGHSDNRSYRAAVSMVGRQAVSWSNDGSTDNQPARTATVTYTPPQERIVLRFTFNGDVNGDNLARFERGPTLEGPWTQIGADNITSGVETIFQGEGDLFIGGQESNENPGETINNWEAVIHNVIVENLGTGDIIASPSFEELEIDQEELTDEQGNVWTWHGDTEVSGIAVDSITPEDDRVWLKSINYPFLNQPIECVDIIDDITNPTHSGSFHVIGRTRNIAIHDVHGDDEFTLNVTTETITERDNLKFAALAGGTFLLSVPPESDDDEECGDMWGMLHSAYIQLGDVTRGKRVRGKRILEWNLICTVVNRPGNGVVPTTINWTGVERTYNSWNELLAENDTWLDLLERVIHPSNALIR